MGALLALSTACRSPEAHRPPRAERTAHPAPADTPPDLAPPPRREVDEVDLLHVVPVTLTVSSVVDNANDTPPRLVDGDLATAWSARSGELGNAWIELRVPAGAYVTAIGITAGYTHARADLDLFTANVRIRRLRLRWNGEPIGEFPLDPDSRTLQRVAVGRYGGDLRIEFAEVLPGSNPRWRELSVSELVLLGTTPSPSQGLVAPTLMVADRSAGTPWPLISADRDVRRAFTQLRRNILGEGLHPEVDGIYGCSGGGANHCVETVWLDLGDALAAFARARCGGDASVGAALAAYESARAASEREMEAMRAILHRYMEHPGPATEERLRASEQRAGAANQRSAEAASAALRRCRGDRRLGPVADWLPSRNTDVVPRWAPMP